MRHESDDEPPQLAQPALGGCEEQREHDEVRPPVLAVDPQQALNQHPDRIERQVVQVRRLLLQERM
jgi:hypothetical protein